MLFFLDITGQMVDDFYQSSMQEIINGSQEEQELLSTPFPDNEYPATKLKKKSHLIIILLYFYDPK